MNFKKKSGYLLKGIVPLLLCFFMAATCFSSIVKADSENAFAELEGKTAGVVTGTPQDEMVKPWVKNPKFLYFNSVTDTLLALNEGKVDYCVNSTVTYRTLRETYPDLAYVDAVFKTLDVGTIFPKNEDGKKLKTEFDEYIKRIKEDGIIDEYDQYWLYPNDWETIDIPSTGAKGILTMATCSSQKPFSFRIGEDFVGFDIAVAAGFCEEYGYGLEIEDVDFAGCLSGIASGKYDLAAGQISKTEEREKSVLFSETYYQQEIVPICLKGAFENVVSEDSDQAVEADASWVESFRRTVIYENRWKTILHGLGVTLLITLAGFILANFLGAAFCALAMSKHLILRGIADVYSRIMQGTPIVVILMILYYIVFGNSDISGIVVSMIGFGITSGAYLAQLFEGAICGVDKGQMEAALAIGFTKSQAFGGIILPQAIRSMLPGYFSQLISLMKGTAVVGYIAVVDLTKAGDIIRSSTFEPFFPLIIVAVLYFAIACILLSVLKQIQKKLAPKRLVNDAEGGKA